MHMSIRTTKEYIKVLACKHANVKYMLQFFNSVFTDK